MLVLSRRLKRNPRCEAQCGSDDLLRIEYTPTFSQSMPGNCVTFRAIQMSNATRFESIVRECIVLKQRQLLRPEHGWTEQRQIVSEALALLEPEPSARSGEAPCK
jgi:hypothetical protein